MTPIDNNTKRQTILEAFVEHRSILISYLAQKLNKPDDIDDLLQDTFLQAYRAEMKGDINSPKSYLFIIARNLLSKKFAKQAKNIVQEITDVEFRSIKSTDISIERQLHGKMKMSILEEAIKTLPPQCRRVFLLRKIYGLPQKKIASKLDISVSTVERHVTIAINRLSAIMSKKGYNQSKANVKTLVTNTENRLK